LEKGLFSPFCVFIYDNIQWIDKKRAIMFSKIATEEMVAQAVPPDGYYSIVSNSPFGWEVGPFFERQLPSLDVERGFRVDNKHLNTGGVCHSGVLMTFADILIASAVMKILEPPFVTVKLTTDFIDTVCQDSWVYGTADVTGVEDGFASVTGVIKVDDQIVATISAVFKSLVRTKA
jgi:acyl-coenzyme A thioesterase PaaI-like protein